MFCKDICKLVLGVNVAKANVSFLIMITQEVKAHINVFGLGLENWVFGYTYGTCAVTKQRHSSEN